LGLGLGMAVSVSGAAMPEDCLRTSVCD